MVFGSLLALRPDLKTRLSAVPSTQPPEPGSAQSPPPNKTQMIHLVNLCLGVSDGWFLPSAAPWTSVCQPSGVRKSFCLSALTATSAVNAAWSVSPCPG